MKLKFLAGAALATVFLASGALAEENGWYGAIDAGAHKLNDYNGVPQQDTAYGSAAPLTFKDKYDFTVFGRLGYQVMPHLRLEIEGGYRPGRLKGGYSNAGNVIAACATGTGVINPDGSYGGGCAQPNGYIRSYSAMANAIVDIFPASTPSSAVAPARSGKRSTAAATWSDQACPRRSVKTTTSATVAGNLPTRASAALPSRRPTD